MTKRRLCAIVFADIVGYTAMMQRDEQEGLEKVRRFREVIEAKITTWDGEVLQFMGDGCLCIFQSAVQALYAARDIQQNLRDDPHVPLRIGIHVGDIVIQEGNIYGDGVNLASRVESMGVPGSVLVTERLVYDIKNHPDLRMVSLGEFHFKNVEHPMQVFALANDGFPVPDPEELQGKFKEKPVEKRKAPPLVVWAILGILGLIAVGWLSRNIWMEDSGVNSGEKIMAVLPFSATGDTEGKLTAFGESLQGELTHQLSAISGLTLINKNSLSGINPEGISPEKISRNYHLSYFVEGTVRLVRDKVYVIVNFVDAQTQKQLWSASIEEIWDENNPEIQDEISRKIKNYILISINQSEVDLPTNNIEAYDLYLKVNNRLINLTPEKSNEALRLCRNALKLDPDFGEIYGAIAMIYRNKVQFMGEPETLLDSALYYAKKAVAINPNSVKTRLDLALILQVLGENEEAKTHLKKIIGMSPESGRVMLSNMYNHELKYDSAYYHLKKHLLHTGGNHKSNESLFANLNLIRIFSDLGRFDSAEYYLEKASFQWPQSDRLKQAQVRYGLDIRDFSLVRKRLDAFFSPESESPFYQNFRGIVQSEIAMLQSNWDLAYQQFPWDKPGTLWQSHIILGGMILQQTGRIGQADSIFRTMKPLIKYKVEKSAHPMDCIWLAICEAGLGEMDQASETLGKLVERGYLDENDFFLEIAAKSVLKTENLNPLFEQIKKNRQTTLSRIENIANQEFN